MVVADMKLGEVYTHIEHGESVQAIRKLSDSMEFRVVKLSDSHGRAEYHPLNSKFVCHNAERVDTSLWIPDELFTSKLYQAMHQ